MKNRTLFNRSIVICVLMMVLQVFIPFLGGVTTEANTEENSLRIHFEAGDRDFEEMSLWLYGDVEILSEEVGTWPNGSTFSNEQVTDFGPYLDVDLKEQAEVVNVIGLYQGDRITDDLAISLLSSDMDEVWIYETGEISLYEPVDLPENTIRVHWNKDDEQYKPWGLWLWGDVETPSEDNGGWPTGATPFTSDQTGRYGAYVDIDLNSNPNGISFLFANRENQDEQFGDYSFSDFRNHNQIFLRNEDSLVYTNPYYISRGEEVETEAVIPEWVDDAVIYEVNIRQYTKEGTFDAFSEHLPRLKDLGVDVLWLMPIHPISEENRLGTLGSYYAISDYGAINPEFGTLDDFEKLVKQAQDMGFYVVLDWVANHTGWDHHWIEENPDYYRRNDEGEILHPGEFDWTDVAQLDYTNPELRDEMKKEMKFWVEEYNIDGFRADYASGVPVDFWEDISTELNEIKPLFMLAEDDRVYELLNQAFFVNWGWGFHHIMNDVAVGNSNKNEIINHFQSYPGLYPSGTFPMQFIDSHDENSWEGTIEERLGDAADTMATLYFTVPGMPMIYSGQEAGLNKRLEFFEKDLIDWSDLSYQEFYQDLISLKKSNPALWNGNAGGDIQFLETSSDDLLAFSRTKEDNTVLVIMNLSNEEISEELIAEGLEGIYNLAFEDDLFEVHSTNTFDLSPWEYQVLTIGSIEVDESDEPEDEETDEEEEPEPEDSEELEEDGTSGGSDEEGSSSEDDTEEPVDQDTGDDQEGDLEDSIDEEESSSEADAEDENQDSQEDGLLPQTSFADHSVIITVVGVTILIIGVALFYRTRKNK